MIEYILFITRARADQFISYQLHDLNRQWQYFQRYILSYLRDVIEYILFIIRARAGQLISYLSTSRFEPAMTSTTSYFPFARAGIP